MNRPARARAARVAVPVALALAMCLPLVWTTTRAWREIADARHALAAERLAASDARIVSTLLFEVARLRVAFVRPQLVRESVPTLEGHIARDLTRVRRETAPRLRSSDCPSLAGWSRRYRRFAEAPTASDAPEPGLLVGDLACYTFELSTASPLATDANIVIQDATSIGAMSVPGVAGHVADTMVAFDRAIARGRMNDTLATARSLGYVTRNRENLDGAIAEIRRLSAVGEPLLDRLDAAASASERRFEAHLLAALARSARPVAYVTVSERDALATTEAYRALGDAGFDALVVRTDAAERELDGRSRDATVGAVVGFAFALALVALATRLASAYHARRLRYVALERDALAERLARANAERSLSLTEDQMRAVFETADAAIAIFDDTRRAIRCNETYERLRARVTTLDATVVDRIAPLFAGDVRYARCERTLPDLATRDVHLDVSLASVYDGVTCRYAIATVVDVTEVVDLRERLRAEALRDGLTGIANRRAFERALESTATRARGYAIFYIDLDRFKPINDRLGHAAGDAVLGIVAARLAAAVAGGDLVARLGGDEFAVIACDVSDATVAATIAARLLAAIERPIALDATTVAVSASVGVALACEAGDAPGGVLARADAAMYDAKRARGTYRIAAVAPRAVASSS